MATITKVEEFTKKNNKKGWKFFLSDGASGYISNEKPWEYKQGEEVTYTKVNKGTYDLLTLTRVATQTSKETPAPTPTPQTPQEKPPAQRLLPHAEVDIIKMKFDSRMQLVKLTHDLLLAGKLGEEEAKMHLGAWTSYVDGLIDGIFA